MTEQERQEKLEREDRIKRRKEAAKSFITGMNDADKQRFITYLAYLALLVLAILSSSLSLLFDPSQFDFKAYIIAVAFNIAFGVMGLVLSLKDGRLSNETRRKGNLYETKQEFKRQANLIVDDDSFRQWNDEFYKKNKLDHIKNDLARININTLDYLKVSDSDLETLKNEDIEYNGKVLDKITPYQYEIIVKYRNGDFVYKKLPCSFFKSETYKDEYKEYADSEGKNDKVEAMSFIYRIAMIILIPAIFGLAVVNPTSAGAKTIAYDTASRIMNVLTSIFLGYSLAHDEAARLTKSLIFKINAIKQYLVELATGIFVPISRDEQQLKKLAEIRAKREKEVLDPPEKNDDGDVVEMTEEEYQTYLENAKKQLEEQTEQTKKDLQ